MIRKIAPALLALAIAAEAQAAPRYLAVTDSIHTQAYGSTRPSKMSFNLVNNNITGIVDVLGSPGLTTAPQGGYAGAVDLLPAIEIWKGRYGARWVFLLTGTNDHGLSVPLETYKTSLRTLAAGIDSMGLEMLCIKPLWKSTQNVRNDYGLVLVDYSRAMESVCDEFGFVTLTFAATSTDFIDGIHLNETGHAKFAEWFTNVGVFFGAWSKLSTTFRK